MYYNTYFPSRATTLPIASDSYRDGTLDQGGRGFPLSPGRGGSRGRGVNTV